MAILHALGVDVTFLYQFVIAAFAFFALSAIAFGPYMQALEEREKRTTGGEAAAENTQKEAIELRGHYEQKARELAGEIKTIFDSYRVEANKEYESIIQKARAQANSLLAQTRDRVTAQILDETKKLKEQTPQISQAMVNQLLSKKS